MFTFPAEFPIVTAPVDVPVLMFVALPELALMLTAPPVMSAPDEPVSNPAELI
jgi:hypothetical protein